MGHFGAWLNGRTDGKKSIPSKDAAEHSPYEKRLAQTAKENIKRAAQRWEDEDKELKGKYCDAKREYIDALRCLNRERKEHGLASKAYTDALGIKRESSTYPHLSLMAYRLLIGFIAIGEMPLTAIVFDILGEARLLTYVFAAVLCVVLPTSAHFLGVIIREEFNKKKGVIFAINLLIFVGVLVAIAYMREKFFEASDFQKVLGVQMDPTVATIVFILIQAFIFTVATTASYFAHDPHPNLKRSLKEFDDAKRRLEKENKDTIEAEERVNKAAEILTKVTALREGTFKRYKYVTEEVKAIHERVIEVYRTHNLRKRSDTPISFSNYPIIEIPKSLQVLDEDCGLTDDLEGESFEGKDS